jgi:UDP-N-acetylglucosamine 2-epimerase (non-hydrolysing)
MKKLKVMSIFGTRPEASKMAPVIKALEKNENIESIVCVTAQHREMLDQTMKIFEINPDYDLNIMKKGQTLTDITCRAIKGIEEVLEKEQPDLVLAHGDTSTTFAASLAAFYQKVSVGHVEAGLRTFDKYQPFPEEMNRKLTCALADIHFSPTTNAKQNLLNEGINADIIYVTGNTAIDCIDSTVKQDYTFELDALNDIDYKNNRVIVMTAHRRENIGEPLEEICEAAKRIVAENEDVVLVYAVHFNPLVQETARRILGGLDRVVLTDPIGMLDMHNLMARSFLLLTDSGGLQEEAPALDKPVIVLRNVTERPEGIDAGTLKLAGTDGKVIHETVTSLLNDKEQYDSMAGARNPFGDGKAAGRIVDAILHHFGYVNDRPVDF